MDAKNLPATVQTALSELTIKDESLGKYITQYITKSLAPNTYRSYTEHLRKFTDQYPFPATPENVLAFIKSQNEDRVAKLGKPYKNATVQAWINAISLAHRSAGHPDPTEHVVVKKVLEGVRRENFEPQKQAKALSEKEISAMVHVVTNNPVADLRNSVMVLLMYLGGLRSEHVVNMRVENIRRTDPNKGDGYDIFFSKEKQRQRQERKVFIPSVSRSKVFKISELLEQWLITTRYGFVFKEVQKDGSLNSTDNPIHPKSVRVIIKNLAYLAKIEDWERVSSHSLRVSFVTNSYRMGYTPQQIAKQTGQSLQTVMRYIQETDLYDNNPVTKLL